MYTVCYVSLFTGKHTYLTCDSTMSLMAVLENMASNGVKQCYVSSERDGSLLRLRA